MDGLETLMSIDTYIVTVFVLDLGKEQKRSRGWKGFHRTEITLV